MTGFPIAPAAVTDVAAVCGNERLRGAMVAANVTIEALAEHLGMAPESVDRWLTSQRTPHARNAEAAARLLGTDAYHLWPRLAERHRSAPTPQDEVVACYPIRSTVPAALWRDVLANASTVVDLAITHLVFLADAVWDLPALLADKTAAGVRVRIVTPTTPVGPVANLTDLFPTLSEISGLRLVTHPGLRADVLRGDDDLLITTPVDGLTPAVAPVLHLRRLGPAPMTGGYLAALDHLFATATPASAPRLRAVAS
ncbi:MULTISPECIES: helix-turn-helix domain-containing protein [Streptomyces]|uniref:Helix-turn-helix domain-containing protein n=1 Tax=Streptomyces ehimensis TaxID=68195 RepID=A0ABV9BH63_9ACTN